MSVLGRSAPPAQRRRPRQDSNSHQPCPAPSCQSEKPLPCLAFASPVRPDRPARPRLSRSVRDRAVTAPPERLECRVESGDERPEVSVVADGSVALRPRRQVVRSGFAV